MGKNQGDTVPKPPCPFVQLFGVCSGQGSDPKNQAGNGESSSCELENVDFGGVFRRGWGCASPGFAFLSFHLKTSSCQESHVVPGASSAPSPCAQAQLPEVQSLHSQPRVVGFGFYFLPFP